MAQVSMRLAAASSLLVLLAQVRGGVTTATSLQDPPIIHHHYMPNFDNVSYSLQSHNLLSTFAHWYRDPTPPLQLVADDVDRDCTGENSALGTCGVRGWAVDGRQNYMRCLTGWIQEGNTTIPSCGERQLCTVAGIRRTTPGKPISCKVFSRMRLQGNRQWIVEVGTGSECKVACFNSIHLKDYSVSEESFIGEKSTAPLCLPDTMYLTGNTSECSVTRKDNSWTVEGQPDYSHCSARCYDRRWPFMSGVETIRYTGRLRDAYDVCFLSYAYQESSTNASCQLSVRNDDWWFNQEGEGLHCEAKCSCNDLSGYCKRL